MDESTIDQGTIIYGIRSDKYPTVPCYGIIITARCDIAQKKVPKYYFLVAVDASEWFCTNHGYSMVYKKKIHDMKNVIDSLATELDLNGDVLISLTQENIDVVLANKRSEYSNNGAIKKIDSLSKKIAEYYIFVDTTENTEKRRQAIHKNPKPAIEFLKEIDQGKHLHYYYLPQKAYLGNNIFDKGLIVDLLEISQISISDVEKIKSPGIDFKVLPKIPSREDIIDATKTEQQMLLAQLYSDIQEHYRLTSLYWLTNDSDFVVIEETIKSPWCEHLMQRFSNAFIRIGIDNPSPDDFEEIIKRCYTGSDSE